MRVSEPVQDLCPTTAGMALQYDEFVSKAVRNPVRASAVERLRCLPARWHYGLSRSLR